MNSMLTHLRAIFGVLAISLSAVFVRLSGSAPSTSAFFRTAYALPVLYLGWLAMRGRDHRTRRRRWLAVFAGTILGLDLAMWHRAIEDIGTGPATVLGNTQVVLVGVVAWLVLGERPSRSVLWLLPVVLAGVALVGGVGSAQAYGVAPARGAAWGLGTGVAYAGFLLTMRFANAGRTPAIGPLADATLGAAIATLLVGLLDPRFDLRPVWPMHGWLVALALGSQVIGWLLITHALPRLPILETSVLLLLQPIATLMWGRWLFDEQLASGQMIGVILVLAGVSSVSVIGVTRRRERA